MNNLRLWACLIGLFAFQTHSNPLHAQSPCVDSSLIISDALCTTDFNPVCGCNGITYSNSCEAVYHNGVTQWVLGNCAGNNCGTLSTSFSYFPVSQTQTVFFSDESAMPNAQIVGWTWAFGDGTLSAEQNPSHVFTAPGQYLVCLSVTSVDANGQVCEGTACQSVTIPEDCFDNCLYEFEYDLNGTALHAEFDFGDIDPPFFFYVNWSLDGGAATGTGLDFVQLIKEPGIHTLCATYPTGDFTPETCTVCRAIEVTAPCVDSSQINPNTPCPTVIIPVCGCDGVTYDNDCVAYNYGGVTSWLPGACGSICNNLFVDFIGENTGGTLTVWTFQEESVFPGGTISSWFWDFGNGQTSMEEAPTLNFLLPGEYEVCLTVSGLFADGTQCGGTVCKKIVVAEQTCIDPNVIDPNVLCAAVYEPVCGCDGITYPNECVAYNYNGITAWVPGICPTDCVNPAWIDSNAVCFEIYDPVCGCDEVTYPNDCYALNYGGVTSWTKGVCCENPECKALFEIQVLSGNTVLIKNLSLNAEAASLNFGDGSPLHPGIFDTVTHYYTSPGAYQICLEISNFAGTCTDVYCAIVDFTTPISEPNAHQIQLSISPNPADSRAWVSIGGAQPRSALLLDIYGKKVWDGPVSGTRFELETSQFPAGIYFLHVQTDQGAVSRKLVLAR